MNQPSGNKRPISEFANVAALPFRILEERGIPCGYERSFKMRSNRLLANRYMLGIDTTEFSREELTKICNQLCMPDVYLEDFRKQLMGSNLMLLGFEHDGDACSYKIYLEYWNKLQVELMNGNPPHAAALLHLGYKWDVFNDDRRTLARYICYPKITVDEILARIKLLYANALDQSCYAIVQHIIKMASQTCGDRDLIYIEAQEDGNSRRSFDVNLYQASLQLDKIEQSLSRMQAHFDLCPDEFRRLLKLIMGKQLGHLSGGLDRRGDDFLTVYYEA